ncbi:olfactory receptor 13G1-like [Pleurodeles waltl]|uniref:olfactory receptor 13G1-like n=1 Tax=Pleurodeles waltl TaxID=8319 RepID=UPI003709596F
MSWKTKALIALLNVRWLSPEAEDIRSIQLQTVDIHLMCDFRHGSIVLDPVTGLLVHEEENELFFSDKGEDVDVMRADDAKEDQLRDDPFGTPQMRSHLRYCSHNPNSKLPPFSDFSPSNFASLLFRIQMIHHMSGEGLNLTHTSEFIMLGFSAHPQLQSTFFTLFLLIYLMALLGNLLIITIIGADVHLRTPMYFFLGNLAVLDICCTSSTIPMMLETLLSETKSISFSGCITQLFLLSSVLGTELLILTLMAFDRYVAICLPLRYTSIMSMKFCVTTVVTMWFCGLVNSTTHTSLITKLSFYGRITLDHVFCEIPPILKVSSSDAYITDSMILLADIFLGLFCFLLTCMSYMYILSSIVKIRSAAKKSKAFHTCTSHLLVVTVFYGGIIYTYVRPALNVAGDKDKVVSVIYAVVSPVLNPIIYSLRNEEVKKAFAQLMPRSIFSWRT